MAFKKGQSGNPAGKPKGANQPMTDFLNAIKKVEKQEDRKKLMEHFVEQAYTDNKVLIALMKKILPDKKSQELMGDLKITINETHRGKPID